MMRVLVLGSTGMLGVAMVHRLRQDGFEVLTLDRSQFDACDPDFNVIAATGADAIINAIGLINRRLDRPESEFLRTNSLYPRRLADFCAARGIRLIHISTDCVFDGANGPYDESSPALAHDLYGLSKHWGEAANALVIRTSIIGPERFNHYSLLCWYLRQQVQVNGYRNHLWNGVTTLELSRAVSTILRDGLYAHGLYHVHGEDLSKFQLLQLIRDAFDAPATVNAGDDTVARDTRLRTCHPDFLAALGIAPMRKQLAALREVSDNTGHWTAR
jgi:dTDP-4-dehydrorhamnose reductase